MSQNDELNLVLHASKLYGFSLGYAEAVLDQTKPHTTRERFDHILAGVQNCMLTEEGWFRLLLQQKLAKAKANLEIAVAEAIQANVPQC